MLQRVLDVLNHLKLPGEMTVSLRTSNSGRLFAQIEDLTATCNVSGRPAPWRGRKWFLSDHMTDGEVVQTLLMATLAAIEHEVREQFLYKGQAIFDPHYDIEMLVKLRAQPNALREREPVSLHPGIDWDYERSRAGLSPEKLEKSQQQLDVMHVPVRTPEEIQALRDYQPRNFCNHCGFARDGKGLCLDCDSDLKA